MTSKFPPRAARPCPDARNPWTCRHAPRHRRTARAARRVARAGHVRHGLLLGRRADVLADARRRQHQRRLCRRRDAEPDLSGSLFGWTGHAEVVRVFFDPPRVSYDELLKVFWEGHDPTQGMRQGNDVGTQYRSALYYYDDAQRAAAEASRDAYQDRLTAAGYGAITTEFAPAPTFYYAEAYHQQYLSKNPNGYCGHGGTGVTCPIGVKV